MEESAQVHVYLLSHNRGLLNNFVFCNSRDFIPALAPDGRPFPISLTQCRDPVTFPLSLLTHRPPEEGEGRKGEDDTGGGGQTEGRFPRNVEFIHVSMTL